MKGTVNYYTPKRSAKIRKTHRKYRWQLAKSKRIMQKMSRRRFKDAQDLTISNCNIITDPNEWNHSIELKNSKSNQVDNTVQKHRNLDGSGSGTTGPPLQEFDANFHEIHRPKS